MKKNVFIVIVTWNGKKQVLRALTSIFSAKRDASVIVVDNASGDGTCQAIENQFPQVTLIKNQKNLGFAGGNNVGISRALEHGADYVWLLNNDTQIDSHPFVLTQAFDDTRVGIAGSKIYFAKGAEYHKDRYKATDLGNVVWYAGGLVDWNNMYASHRGVDEVDHGQYDKVQDTAFVTGCSMMISRRVIKEIGMFDERYYLYLEDVDFCLRAKKAGFGIIYFPQSKVWHDNAGSSGGPGSPLHEYYQTRNRYLIGFRFAPMRTKIALLRESIRFLISDSDIKKRAAVDALLGRWGLHNE